MIQSASWLYESPNPLSPHYSKFRVDERLLLTGHSHQAWPDRAEAGQLQAWEDAALLLDEKWERAFERANRVRSGYARLMDTSADTICLAASTHELVVKWLSALPLRERRRIVTTNAEFHSARRQLKRLEEEGLEIHRVEAYPAATVGERLAQAVTDQTAAVMVSTVFFDTGEIAGGLTELAQICETFGSALLLDAYHQLNVVPFSLRQQGLESAFVTGGGYKYCQLGEGNAFLRSPTDCTMRPAITGWFAEFGEISSAKPNQVSYGPLNIRFAGATYDPTSNYRAAEVFDFFAEMQLTPDLLREASQHQVGRIRDQVDALDLPTKVLTRRETPIEAIGGFLALQSPFAGEIQRELARRGVLTDSRRNTLRLGPAPYLDDDQIDRTVATLGQVVRDLYID